MPACLHALQIPTAKHGKTLYYTSDIVHKDEAGDYQVYGRVNDAIRYRGELLNLPSIEGAAVSTCDSIVSILYHSMSQFP